MLNRGKNIIIVAPSGTGKSTLIKMLSEKYPNLKWSVSTTTRAKRAGEVEGRDYFYVSENKFTEMISGEMFVEWAKVHGNYYGTSKSFVENGLSNGLNLLFDLDLQGVDSFKKLFPHDTVVIFIKPPSIDVLAQRLLKRNTDSEEVIQRRLQSAEKEITRADDFDHTIVNNDLEEAFTDLVKIIDRVIKNEK